MFHRLAIIAVSIAVTSGAYLAYAWCLAPLIDPPPRTVANSTETSEDIRKSQEEHERRNRERFAGIFREGDWELDSPKVIEGERVAMMMRDYTPMAGGKIELKPCTLVFFPEGRSDAAGKPGRAMVLQAPEGAVLQFDASLDVRRGRFGKLQGGKLSGPVTIRCGESSPGAGDDLEIKTQNVQMTPDRILTPHEVTFRYGQSHGTGSDLTITLLSKADASAADPEAGAVSGGIRSIELVHVDKVHLEMTPVAKTSVRQTASQGGQGGTGGVSLLGLPVAENRGGVAAGRLPVEITCRGPFVFDALKRVASFEDNVDVLRLHPDGLTDQLQCKVLEILFAAAGTKTAGLPGDPDRAKSGSAQAGNASGPGPTPIAEAKTPPSLLKRALPPLAVELVRALGQPVVVRIPSYAVEARGDRLEYDFRTKSLRLDAEGTAELKHGAHLIRTRALEYTFAEEDDPGQLGKLWAAGPGMWSGTTSEIKGTPFTVQWAKQLALRPHESYQVASLTDRATVIVEGTGRLDADELHLWIKPNERPGNVPDSAPADAPVATRKPAGPNVRIEKILCKKNIQFDSQQIAGNTQQLEIWLDGDLGGGPIKPVQTARGPTYPIAPRGPAPSGQPSGEAPVAPPQKFHVSSDLIRVLLASAAGQTVVEGATLEGSVRVTETQTPRVGDQPLTIAGRSVQFSGGRSPATSTITLLGSPAEINARGYGLVGNRVFVHRGESRVTVEGEGKMLLPAQRDLQGQAVAGGQTFAVEWKDGLKFDGRTLACEHGVTIRGATQTATCDWLEAQLSRPIDMLAAELPRDTQLGRIVLHEQVYMENRTSDAQGLLAFDRMQVRDLVIDQSTGEVASAPQPGWMTTIRRGTPALRAAPAGGGPMQPLPGGQNGLSYLRVDFQGGLSGNMQRRELRFLNQVKAVYGPVAEWNAVVDPNSPRGLADAVTLGCDQLAVVELPISPVQKTLELQASGNTIVEGRGFTARCARLAYTEAKDLLVLEGDGRADAELTRRDPVQGDAHAAASKILFWKTANQVQVDGARFLDLLNLGPQPAARPPGQPRR